MRARDDPDYQANYRERRRDYINARQRDYIRRNITAIMERRLHEGRCVACGGTFITTNLGQWFCNRTCSARFVQPIARSVPLHLWPAELIAAARYIFQVRYMDVTKTQEATEELILALKDRVLEWSKEPHIDHVPAIVAITNAIYRLATLEVDRLRITSDLKQAKWRIEGVVVEGERPRMLKAAD